MVCPTEVLSPNFMPLGVLSPEVCPSGRFVSERFVWVSNKQLDYSLPAVRLPCNVPALVYIFPVVVLRRTAFLSCITAGLWNLDS
jgi:hypothetical protein